MGGIQGRVQLRRRLLAPGKFCLLPAASGLLAAPGDDTKRRQMLLHEVYQWGKHVHATSSLNFCD